MYAQQHRVRLSTQATFSAAEQAEALQRLIAERIDLLILTPLDDSSPALRAAIAQAEAAGTPIITCEHGGSQPADYARCDVRADLADGAHLATSYLAERLGRRGKILHLAAPFTKRRKAGFTTAVQQYPALEVVEADSDWTAERSAQLVRAALADHPDLGAIFAHNDWMALGAAAAVAEAGRTGQVLVAGIDAIPQALQALADQQLAATVYAQPELLGRTVVESGLRLLRGETLPPLIEVPVMLVTHDTFLAVALEELAIMPTITAALAESTMSQHTLQDTIIDAQHQIIRELSTPVIPISEAVLILPLIGEIDSQRAQQILDAILDAIKEHRARVLIMDITGVPVVDTQVAHHLLQATQAAKLLGATAILVGITPEIAQTMVQLGVDFSQIITKSTLQASLEYAHERLVTAGRHL